MRPCRRSTPLTSTPGERDRRLQNLRLRDVETLTIDRFKSRLAPRLQYLWRTQKRFDPRDAESAIDREVIGRQHPRIADLDATRLNKFISESGRCSRREADQLIERRRVKVNGKVAEVGTKVRPGDRVEVDGQLISAAEKERAIYLAYNKPVGIECVTDESVRNNIISAIRHPRRIFPIGRLDVPSEGLIFLTSDGDVVNKILRAGNDHEKEYEVTVNRPVTDEFVARMANGIPILGTVTQKCQVEKLGQYAFSIVLTEGMNRQIRRMCEFLDYEVVKLKRTRIMNVRLGNLPVDEWRDLTEEELEGIFRLVAGSSNTKEASRPRKKKRPPKARAHQARGRPRR